jgi:hypothetical protein
MDVTCGDTNSPRPSDRRAGSPTPAGPQQCNGAQVTDALAGLVDSTPVMLPV